MTQGSRMKLARMFLVLVLAAPVWAAPNALDKTQLEQADTNATSLFVNLDDASLPVLGRFLSLSELRFTGPYDNNL